MKRITLLMVLLLISMTCIMAQTIADYTFSTATNGSMVDMSSGTTTIQSGYYDGQATAVTNIGFSFKLGATTYTQFSANSNGLMRLGATVIGGHSTSPGSGIAYLAPISGDNVLQSTGKIHYKLLGTSPNQKLVVEWNNLYIPYASNPSTGTFSTVQAVIYETSNKVEYIYGTMYNNGSSTASRGVFLSTSNVAGSVGNIININTTPTWNGTATSVTNTTFAASSAMTNLDSAADGARRVFSFLPPDPNAVPNAASIVSPGNAATLVLPSATLNWAPGGGMPTGYRLYFGTDGAGITPPTNIVAGTDLLNVLTYDPNPDMTAGTTYYWQVVPYNANGNATACPIWSFTALPAGYAQIGTGTSTQAKPFGTTWGYERSVALYTAAQVGTVGALDEIAWYCAATTTTAVPYKIYAKTTTASALTAQTWASFVSGAQLVKEGTYTFSSAGWKLFELDSPFPYISGNLIIGVETNYGGGGGGSGHTFHYSTGATGSHQYWNTDTNPPTANGTLNTSLPNVLLHLGELSATPELVVNPTSWDFGQNFLNIPATKQFTISNIGGGMLNLSGVSFTGDFYSITTYPADWDLSTGESTTFTVQYLPTQAGASHTGTVRITDGRAVTIINLSGSCVDPTIYHANLPHVQNFDAVTVPALPLGWSSINVNADAVNWASYASSPYSAPNCASIGYNGSLALDDWMVTPPLSLQAGTSYALDFKYRGGSTSYVEKLKVMLGSGNQVADLTTQVFINENINFVDYTTANATFTVPSTGTYYLGWHAYSVANQLRMYVDDIVIRIPAPVAPEAATVSFPLNGMTTLLNPMLKWTPSTAGEPATSYKVYLNTSGTFTEADLKYTGAATQFQTTGLASGLTYSWKVVPSNANGETPACPTWTFNTPGALQLAEGFEATSFPPVGWANGSSGAWSRSTSTPLLEGTASAYKFTSTSLVYVLSTPLLTINASSTIDFYSRASATSQVLQMVYSTDRTTWTQIGTDITYAATGIWYPISIDLSALAGSNYYISFRTPTQTTTGSIYVDHVIGPNITPVVPGPVVQTAPANAAVNQTIRPTLTWTASTAGGVPLGYKILCDTENPPTTEVAIATGSPYTFPSNLDWGRTYYWSVVPYNTAGDASPNTVRSFTVMEDPTIYVTPETPYLQAFGTVPPAGWSRYTGLYGTALTTTTAGWTSDDFLNIVTVPANPSARLEIWSTTTKYWLVTAPISIPATGYQMKMDIGLTNWSTSAAVTPGNQADDKFIVVISDSPTMTDPTILREWNNTDSPYVYDEISNTGENQSIDLSAYTGIKYIAFYGESTLSGGDNNIYVDNVLIRQIPDGPPEPVTLNSPADEAENLSKDGFNLTWTPSMTGGEPETYAVFMSQNAADPTDDQYWDGITMTSFDPTQADDPLTFSYGETWYWTVMASNADGDAETPEAFSFTIMDDPRIISLPYSQNFDGVPSSSMPVAWTGYVGSTNTSAYVRTTTSYPVSAPNSVYLTNSSDTAADLRLITPEILVPINTIKLSFSARGSSTAYNLLVGTVDALDGTGTFTEVASLDLTAAHVDYSVPFNSYNGTDQYICFKHGLGGTYRSIYIDNVYMEALLANDMAATALVGPSYGLIGDPLSFNVTVKNNGTATQSSYNVHLKQFGGARLATIAVSTPLASEATAMHTITWTPATTNTYNVVGEVELAGDANALNNETAQKVVGVYPADAYRPLVGDPLGTTSANTLPTNLYWKNGVTETIYTATEMQMSSGTIQGIAYFNNFTDNVMAKHIKIWAQNTTAADLSTAWLPFDDYTLVFDGLVDFPIGANTVFIPFSAAIAYTGGNLAIRVNRVIDTEYAPSSNVFFYTTPKYGNNRSRYIQSDSTIYDPTNPGLAGAGTMLSNIPVTAFMVTNAVPVALAQPAVTITKVGANVALNWTAIPGAYAYRVFVSADPYTFTNTPVATVYTNTYSVAAGANAKNFYKVVAVSSYREDTSDFILNPPAAIGFEHSAARALPVKFNQDNKD